MSSVWIVYLFVPVIIGLFLAEYKADIFRVIKAQFFYGTLSDESIDLDVVFYVPSARENFDQRSAIRDTWWAHARINETTPKRHLLKFVIGSQSCDIHASDRISEYSCERFNMVPPSLDDDAEYFAIRFEESLEDITSVKRRAYGQHSLSFTVLHPIVLTKLGVYKESGSDTEKANVRLLEATTRREIVSTVFSKETPGVRVGYYRFRPVEKYLLPKGFNGVIVADSLSSGNSKLSVARWNMSMTTVADNSTSVVRFYEDVVQPDGHYDDIHRWNALNVHLVSFMYSIDDIAGIRNHIQNISARNEERVAEIAAVSESLIEEAETYQDIQFVDVVDIYRNIPQKMLLFARWAVENLKFKYLLKTDDDCFVDVDRVTRKIEDLHGMRNVWLGRFRSNWMVEKHGKWAELDYTSSVYPKFACGSGYVLSRDLIQWIAANADTLKIYQGEDVSMGIWLAAVGPHFIDEPLWQCEKECLSNMYCMPELRPEELEGIWADKMSCDDPCGCN